ncbi:hypothetical protein BH09BAC2_BH09BAC2_23240 [soil metagenome]
MSKVAIPKLGKFINVINGFAFKSGQFLEYKKENSLPVIKIKNVANGDVNLKDVHFYSYTNSLAKFVIKKGDTLIALTGNHPEIESQVVGLVSKYKLDEKALLNQRVAKIVSKDEKELNNEFLYYFLKDKKTHQYLASQSTGSANQANISKTDIENIDFEKPLIGLQNFIAETLTSFDNKIDLLQRQNQTLEALAETVFKQKFIEEENTWDEKPLDTIAEFLNGLACQKYPIKKGEIGLPVIKIKELKAGISDASDVATNDVPTKYLINDGDMLFSWSGSLDVAIWFGGKGVLNQHLFKVSSTLYPQWFYYYWVKFYLPIFKGIANDKATTMGHIQRHHLADVSVTVPDAKTMKELDAIFNPFMQKIKSNSQQINTLTTLRDTLLPKLMSGEVTIKNTANA